MRVYFKLKKNELIMNLENKFALILKFKYKEKMFTYFFFTSSSISFSKISEVMKLNP